MSGTLRLRGATSGYSELQAPAVAADQTFILPTAGGTLLTTDSPVAKLTLQLGSNSQPSLTFEGDTDTGLYSSGTNTLNLVTGGSDRLVIDSSGQVGIGTTSPSTLLDISSSDNTYVTVQSTANDKNALTYYKTGQIASSGFYVGLNASEEAMVWQTENNDIRFGTNNTDRMRIDSSGNVGVGTTSPERNLHVFKGESGGAASNAESSLVLENSSNTYLQFLTPSSSEGGILFGDNDNNVGAITYVHSNNSLNFTANASLAMTIDSSGNLAIGTTSAAAKLHVENGDVRLEKDTKVTIGFRGHTTGSTDLAFRDANAGVDRMTINSSGQMIIGGTTALDSDKQLTLTTTSTSGGLGILSPNNGRGDIFFGDAADDNIGQIKYSHVDDSLTIRTNAADRLIINSSGNVGIGSTNPVADLAVSNGGASGIELQPEITTNTNRITNFNRSTSSYNNFRLDAAQHEFLISGSEKARIDSSGRLLVQSSSAPTEGLYSQYAPLTVQGYIGSTTGNGILNVARGTTAANLSSGSDIGTVVFSDSAGGEFGRISCFADAAPGSSDYPGRISFHTTSDGSSTPTERMRIDSSGNVGINNLSPTEKLSVAGAIIATSNANNFSAATGGLIDYFNNNVRIVATGTSGVSNGMTFTTTSAGSLTQRMSITSGGKLTVPGVYSGTTTGGSAVYVESDGDLLRFTSSLKYKTDVETLEDARADAILNCRPVWYRSKCANDVKTEGAEKSDWGWYGFIAEEVAEIEPRLVNWATKDAVRQEDGSVQSVERDPADYEAEGVRYENFVPLLLNLVKRQKVAIESLENRIAALENN